MSKALPRPIPLSARSKTGTPRRGVSPMCSARTYGTPAPGFPDIVLRFADDKGAARYWCSIRGWVQPSLHGFPPADRGRRRDGASLRLLRANNA